MEIRPYKWEGPYAEYRTANRAPHDWRLCADVRAPWMGPADRLIIRSCEIVGYEQGFLYDDHFPPSEPRGRGKDYHHIPFEWDTRNVPAAVSANCLVPEKGRFWLELRANRDFVDINLGVRDELTEPMGEIDWAFCVVGRDSPSIGDPQLTRTYLFDGKRLRTLSELAGGPKVEMFKVAGAYDFIPIGYKIHGDPVGSAIAKASVVIVESTDKRHVAALGFPQSFAIFSSPSGNRCFHADPYLGRLEKKGEERTIQGRMYLMEGRAQDAFERYVKEFGIRV